MKKRKSKTLWRDFLEMSCSMNLIRTFSVPSVFSVLKLLSIAGDWKRLVARARLNVVRT